MEESLSVQEVIQIEEPSPKKILNKKVETSKEEETNKKEEEEVHDEEKLTSTSTAPSISQEGEKKEIPPRSNVPSPSPSPSPSFVSSISSSYDPNVNEANLQIEKSLEHLESLKHEHFSKISQIRLDQNQQLQHRHLQDELLMTIIQEKIENEQKRSNIQNAAIQMRWPQILHELLIPQDIERSIQEQEANCQKILKSKEELIEELQQILIQKDEDFMNLLKSQNCEFSSISTEMNEICGLLEGSYQEELKAIEETFERQFRHLFQYYEKDLNKIKDERKEKESVIMNERMNEIFENEKELNQFIEEEFENFQQMKETKMNEIHSLEVKIDEMKGIFEQNSEKLKYYHSVLVEKIKENKQILNQNKKQKSKLQNQLMELKTKYQKDDQFFKQKNQELTFKFIKLSNQYKDLILKFKSFEKKEKKKFVDIQKMKEKKIKELFQSLIQMDRLISVQILKKKNWNPPNQKALRNYKAQKKRQRLQREYEERKFLEKQEKEEKEEMKKRKRQKKKQKK